MADRVYPNNIGTDMGSKTEFLGIDWNEVEDSIKNKRYAQSEDEQLQALVDMLTKEGIDVDQGSLEDAMEPLEEPEKFLPNGDINDPYADDGGAYADAVDSFHNSLDSLYGNEDGEDGNGYEPIMAGKSSQIQRIASNQMKKIAFTSPNQISAEALEAALASGDKAMANTILAARKANRQRIASVIQENLRKEAKLAKRRVERMRIVEAATETEDKAVKFASPTKFTPAQRLAFNQAAINLGLPKEYVEAMVPAPVSPQIKKLAGKMQEVVNAKMSDDTKKSALVGLIKQAKLTPESKSEFIRYWNEVLGYQDKEFWQEAAKDYTKKD